MHTRSHRAVACEREVRSLAGKRKAGTQAPSIASSECGCDLDILPTLTGYLLRRAQVAVYQDFARATGALDVRPAQFAALVVIGANPGLSQRALSGALSIDRSGVVMLLDWLETRGLAVRRPSSVDRRTHAVHLTPQGETLLAQLKRTVRAHDDAVTGSLSPDEKSLLIALLRRLSHS